MVSVSWAFLEGMTQNVQALFKINKANGQKLRVG